LLADVEQVRWGDDEIDAHDEVELSIVATGFDPGAAAHFEVFRLYRERPDDAVATLDATVDDSGQAAAKWTPDSIQPPYGAFIFKATVGGIWRKSDQLMVQWHAKEAAWSSNVASEGDDVTLRARLRGVRDGEDATVTIMEKGWWDGSDEQADQLQASVTDGAIEASWKVPVSSEPLVFGDTGRRDFYFTVEVGSLQCTSQIIAVFPREVDQ
jgi:hypothetical protein